MHRARAALVALAALAWALDAHAHLGHDVARAERYLKLDVSGRRARLVVSLTLGDREGREALDAADADRDGEVSEAERDAYLGRWADGLRTELPVTVDGRPIELRWGEPYLEPIGAVQAAPVTAELVARFELEGGAQRIRIDDRMVRREIYDRTDVAFRARDGAELAASGVGADPAEVTPDLAYGPDYEGGRPVVLTASVRTPERPLSVPWWAWASAAVLALVASAAALAAIRRARQSRNG